MGLREGLVRLLGYDVAAPEFSREKVPVSVREEQTRDDDRNWRTIASPRSLLGGERDLSDWRELLAEAYNAYATNPLAYAVIEQSVNFVLGGGARVVAGDAKVQRWLDRFWRDPQNRMDQRVYALCRELVLFGEQFVRFYVDPVSGQTVIRQLDPLHITAIETDPHDLERVLRYRYAPPGSPGTLAEGGDWLEAGEIAHFTVNRVSNALRGRSDLAPLLPWLRRYRDWLTDRVAQNRYKGTFVLDVTVEGADKGELDRLRAEYAAAPPERGSVLFHNEREKWTAVSPNVGAGEVRDDGRAIRLMIAAGALLPEHYLSEGGNANRATAAEMGLPAIKRMQMRQETFRQVLVTICERVVDEGVRFGAIGPRAKRDLAVHFEELSPAPLDTQSLAAKQLADALSVAQDRGWVSPEEARRLWWRLAGDPEVAEASPAVVATPGVGGAG